VWNVIWVVSDHPADPPASGPHGPGVHLAARPECTADVGALLRSVFECALTSLVLHGDTAAGRAGTAPSRA
jgi:hypothetical protein